MFVAYIIVRIFDFVSMLCLMAVWFLVERCRIRYL